MTRHLRGTGESDPDIEPDPRRLAADVPRWSAGQQHHPEPSGEAIDPPDFDPDYVPGQMTRTDWRKTR